MVAIPVVSALIGVYQTYPTTLLGNRVMADLRGGRSSTCSGTVASRRSASSPCTKQGGKTL
jgi:hypothetical protein